jgi:Ni,Fe-hydrogenase I cytochrome b subunit
MRLFNVAVTLALVALIAVCTYWAFTSGQAASSGQAWPWLGKTLAPAAADHASTVFAWLASISAVVLLITGLMDRAAARRSNG